MFLYKGFHIETILGHFSYPPPRLTPYLTSDTLGVSKV